MTDQKRPGGEPRPDQREAWARIEAIVEAAELGMLRPGPTPTELRQLMADALGAFFAETLAPLLRLLLDPAQVARLDGWLAARTPETP